MEIYLIRHTTPDIPKGIIYGHLDIGVSNDFNQEANRIVSELPENYDIVYSSPSLRCKLLSERLFTTFQYDERLMEINFGDWEGKNWDEISLDELNPWMNDYENIAPPNGENLIQMRVRVIEFLDSIKNLNYQRVILVTHGGVIRIIKAISEKKTIQEVMDEKLSFGAIYKLDW